jgi:hypothetical protein
MMAVDHRNHRLEAAMQKTLLIAGFSALGLAFVLYLLGYTDLNYSIGGTAVLIYPATFFGLLGLVFMFWAVRSALRAADN